MATPLRFYRRMRDMTQQQLGQAVGVSQSAIHHYETGRLFIPDALLPKFAIALGIDHKLLAPPPKRNEETTHVS